MRYILIVVLILIVVFTLVTTDNLLVGVLVPILAWALIGYLAGLLIRRRGHGDGFGALGNAALGCRRWRWTCACSAVGWSAA